MRMNEFAIYPSFWLAPVDIFLLYNTFNIIVVQNDFQTHFLGELSTHLPQAFELKAFAKRLAELRHGEMPTRLVRTAICFFFLLGGFKGSLYSRKGKFWSSTRPQPMSLAGAHMDLNLKGDALCRRPLVFRDL